MGSGLALQVKTKYPLVYYDYINYIDKIGKQNCLGKVQMTVIAQNKFITNLFGQYNFGTEKIQYTSYKALEINKVKMHYNKK